MYRYFIKSLLALGLVSLTAVALIDESTLSPATTGTLSDMDKLKRYKGQTEFLNPVSRRFGRARSAAPDGLESVALKTTEGGKREEQESDIFKIGKAGSKLLYLLNNYRGLQVISFEDGPDKAKLLGRVEATGNWPDDMYYNPKRDQLYVLERVWYDNSIYTPGASRILTYDVSNSRDPRIASSLTIEGEIADSRIVGNILYIATNIRPEPDSHSWDWRGRQNSQKATGKVYSFDLTKENITKVSEVSLTLPVTHRENMNIVEVQNGNSYEYYLIAALSDTGEGGWWSWWNEKSQIEVVDISSPTGEIKPVMVAPVKGLVREKSSTFIKNRTLVVASNYRTEKDNLLRVSVETFKLPDASSKILSEKEAEYLRLRAEYEKIDPQQSLLRGNFVKVGDTLKKLVADSVVTTGDTVGQNASLQDVRYDGNLLYVLWVPQNEVDPLDLFDISSPENGVKHIRQLQFPGWIERAFPIEYKNKKYLLGLGYVRPAANNEDNRRFPQVMLFENVSVGKNVRPLDVANLSLKEANVWTDFNRGDKYVELRMTGEGKGALLFRASGYSNKRYIDGGKLISFDLNQAAEGNYESVFTEGPFLTGNAGWLRRVFSNSEIAKVNTFSDQALGTYNVPSDFSGASSQIAESIGILELARNIQSYFTLLVGEGTRLAKEAGVQVVSDYSYYSDQATKTEFRVVDHKNPDAELSEANVLAIPGRYIAHHKDSDSTFYVLTAKESGHRQENNKYIYWTNYLLSKVGSVKGSVNLKILASSAWKDEESYDQRAFNYEGSSFVKDGGSELFLFQSNKIKKITSAGEGTHTALAIEDIALQNCEAPFQIENPRNSPAASLREVDTFLFITYHEYIQNKDKPGLTYTRNFVRRLSLREGAGTCGVALNIPGEITSFLETGVLITKDESAVDTYEIPSTVKDQPSSYDFVVAKNLVALKMRDESTVELTDLYSAENYAVNNIQRLASRKWVYIEESANENDGWGPMPFHRAFSPRHPNIRRQSSGSNQIVFVSIDSENKFTQTVNVIPGLSLDNPQLSFFETDRSSTYTALVTGGNRAQVIRWVDGIRPRVQKLTAVDAKQRLLKPSDSVHLPQGSWSLRNENGQQGVHYSSNQESFEISQGLHGVVQFFIADEH